MIVPIEVTATPASLRRLRERLEAILRDRAQDLVIVASGNQGLDADGAAREQAAAGAESGMLGASMAADTPEAAQSLARSPASPSDTSIAALA